MKKNSAVTIIAPSQCLKMETEDKIRIIIGILIYPLLLVAASFALTFVFYCLQK